MDRQLSSHVSLYQTGIWAASQRKEAEVFENYILNMASHIMIILRGSFTLADLNQHLFFIKLAAIHRWSAARCACNSHLRIPGVNSDMVFLFLFFFVGVLNLFQQRVVLRWWHPFFFSRHSALSRCRLKSSTTFIWYWSCKRRKQQILFLHSTQFSMWRGDLLFKLPGMIGHVFNCNATPFCSTDCLET